MDGQWAVSPGPAHPPPLTATAAVSHPRGGHEGVQPGPHPPPHPPPVHARAGGPPPAGPDLEAAHAPPLPTDTEDVAGYVLDTQELMNEVDACLDEVGALAGVVLDRAKAWLARERAAAGRAPGKPGWRPSVAAIRPVLAALVEAGGASEVPSDLAVSWAVAARAGRAALALEDEAECRAEAAGMVGGGGPVS